MSSQICAVVFWYQIPSSPVCTRVRAVSLTDIQPGRTGVPPKEQDVCMAKFREPDCFLPALIMEIQDDMQLDQLICELYRTEKRYELRGERWVEELGLLKTPTVGAVSAKQELSKISSAALPLAVTQSPDPVPVANSAKSSTDSRVSSIDTSKKPAGEEEEEDDDDETSQHSKASDVTASDGSPEIGLKTQRRAPARTQGRRKRGRPETVHRPAAGSNRRSGRRIARDSLSPSRTGKVVPVAPPKSTAVPVRGKSVPRSETLTETSDSESSDTELPPPPKKICRAATPVSTAYQHHPTPLVIKNVPQLPANSQPTVPDTACASGSPYGTPGGVPVKKTLIRPKTALAAKGQPVRPVSPPGQPESAEVLYLNRPKTAAGEASLRNSLKRGTSSEQKGQLPKDSQAVPYCQVPIPKTIQATGKRDPLQIEALMDMMRKCSSWKGALRSALCLIFTKTELINCSYTPHAVLLGSGPLLDQERLGIAYALMAKVCLWHKESAGWVKPDLKAVKLFMANLKYTLKSERTMLPGMSSAENTE